MKLQPYLDRMGIHYQMLRHDTTYSAQGLARAEHISGHRVIKPVLVQADGQFVLCAVPASSRVDLDELQRQLGVSEMKLADEQAMARVFEDCELGAEPPIGAIFGLPTVMDDSLTKQDNVTFQAGSHVEAITMAMADYRRIAQPGIAHFAKMMM